METETGTLNIQANSADMRAARLSNFSPDRFELDRVLCASAEGFIQAIMWPEDHPNHALALASFGKAAKKIGAKAERKFVWWNGRTIPFGSAEHHGLIERGIRAKFAMNPDAMEMLLATKGLKLIHDFGRPESPTTSLPAELFCDMLERIRDGLPMVYPCGTPEEPIKISVDVGPICLARASVGVFADCGTGRTKEEALCRLLRTLREAQPVLVLEFDPNVFD